MKTTRLKLKALIREQVAAVINETDWLDVSDPDYHKPQGEAGPYTEPYTDEMEDLLRRIMSPGKMSFGQAMDEFDIFIKKHISGEQESEEGTLKLGMPKHDPLDRSALGKSRRGKMTNFKEGMPEVAGLMSQAGAYEMPPNAMQRLMRVIKEFAPSLSDEELHDFAQQLIDTGALETALGASEEVGLEERKLNEKDLSAEERRGLPDSKFALPGKGTGPEGKQAGSYPIPDEKHARSALSLVAQHGTSEEKAKVRAAVKSKFPGIKQGNKK
tara:strand:+ start:1450 stop:2262 length:813 start_codon:yes stop_codon:yes gene_type:complete